jgi:hypothetical protein
MLVSTSARERFAIGAVAIHVQGHARRRRRLRHIVETTRAEAGRKSVHAMKKVMGALNNGPTI